MDPFMGFLMGTMLGLKPSKPIARKDASPGCFGVSTVNSSDEGYETALLCADGAWPVERYKSLSAARAGHKRWLTKINGKKVYRGIELRCFGSKPRKKTFEAPTE